MGKSESAWSLTNVVGAGVMLIALAASAAGVLQLAKRSKPVTYPATVADDPQVTPERLEQVELERDAALQQIREQRARIAAEQTKPQHKDAKCVGGILFATVNGELRNVGYCD